MSNCLFSIYGSKTLSAFVEIVSVLDAKMSSFSITRKKTPFQKHREEEEAKKKVSIVTVSSKCLYLVDRALFCFLMACSLSSL